MVIYGRGRRAGEPLAGDFNETEFTTQLALVGESCECETDRAWLLEPTAPMRWPERIAERAPGALGFDPESPMVKAEISRILSRGDFGTGRSTQGDGRRPKDLAEIVFGYSEHTLDDRLGESNRPAPAAAAAEAKGAVISSPKVVIRRDDGWDFQTASGNTSGNTSENTVETPSEIVTNPERSVGWFLPALLGGGFVLIVSAIAAAFILRR